MEASDSRSNQNRHNGSDDIAHTLSVPSELLLSWVYGRLESDGRTAITNAWLMGSELHVVLIKIRTYPVMDGLVVDTRLIYKDTS
jgi:hypothetical protein